METPEFPEPIDWDDLFRRLNAIRRLINEMNSDLGHCGDPHKDAKGHNEVISPAPAEAKGGDGWSQGHVDGLSRDLPAALAEVVERLAQTTKWVRHNVLATQLRITKQTLNQRIYRLRNPRYAQKCIPMLIETRRKYGDTYVRLNRQPGKNEDDDGQFDAL